MRSEFEKLPIIQEIITDEYDGLVFDERFSKYLCPSEGNEEYLNGAWMVWQHQQSKVDEMQKQRDSFIKAYDIEMGKNIELQKRVDKAIRLLAEAELYQSEPNIDLAVQALKGDGK